MSHTYVTYISDVTEPLQEGTKQWPLPQEGEVLKVSVKVLHTL